MTKMRNCKLENMRNEVSEAKTPIQHRSKRLKWLQVQLEEQKALLGLKDVESKRLVNELQIEQHDVRWALMAKKQEVDKYKSNLEEKSKRYTVLGRTL